MLCRRICGKRFLLFLCRIRLTLPLHLCNGDIIAGLQLLYLKYIHRLIPVNKVFVLYGGPLYIRFYITASVNTTVPNVYSTGIVSVNFDFIPLTADDVAVSGGLSPISLPVVSEILTL